MVKENAAKLTEICVIPGPPIVSMLRVVWLKNEVSNINTPGIIVMSRRRIGTQSVPITIPKRILSLSGKGIVPKYGSNDSEGTHRLNTAFVMLSLIYPRSDTHS